MHLILLCIRHKKHQIERIQLLTIQQEPLGIYSAKKSLVTEEGMVMNQNKITESNVGLQCQSYPDVSANTVSGGSAIYSGFLAAQSRLSSMLWFASCSHQ